MNYNQEIARKGAEGERLFRRYAEALGIPYLPVDQQFSNMPKYLSAAGGKRPDVVAPMRYDIALIEVKNKKLAYHQGTAYLTLDAGEARRLKRTEKLLGKRVLLAYRVGEDNSWCARYLSDSLADSTTRKVRGRRGNYYSFRFSSFAPLDSYFRKDSGYRQRGLFDGLTRSGYSGAGK